MSIKISHLLPVFGWCFHIIWALGKEVSSEFLNIFNKHEPPIKWKSSICVDSDNYFDTAVFKQPKTNITYWARYLLNQPIFIRCYRNILFITNICLKVYQDRNLCDCFRIFSNEKDVDKAWGILFQSFFKRNYSKDGCVVKELQIKQRQSNTAIPTTSC